jgi:hypothetical protein
MYTVEQEITVWPDGQNFNHSYLFDDRKRCVGYIPKGTTKARFFEKPSNKFSRSHRKFKKMGTYNES